MNNDKTKKPAEKNELTTDELDTVSGGKTQGDLKGALAKLEKEIKSRE